MCEERSQSMFREERKKEKKEKKITEKENTLILKLINKQCDAY